MYVRYNTRLRERSLQRKQNFDPILLDGLDFNDEWIVEKENPLLLLDICWLEDNKLFNTDAIRVMSSNEDNMVSLHNPTKGSMHNELASKYSKLKS